MKAMAFRLHLPAGYADHIGVTRWLIEQDWFRLCSVPDQGDGLIMQVTTSRVNEYVVIFYQHYIFYL